MKGESGEARMEGGGSYNIQRGRLTINRSRGNDSSTSHLSWKKTEEKFLTFNSASVLFVRLGEA